MQEEIKSSQIPDNQDENNSPVASYVDAVALLEMFTKAQKASEKARNKTKSHATSPETRAAANARRSQYFMFEVYPDTKNEGMLYALEYVKENEGKLFPEIAYILHDKDVHEEDGKHNEMQDDGSLVEVEHHAGELKKAHYHVVFKLRNRTTADAMTDFFANAVKVLKIDSIDAQMAYLLHRTPKSIHKYQYPIEALYASKKLMKLVEGEKRNFVQFGELLMQVSEGRPYAHVYWDLLNSDKPSQTKNELLAMMIDKGMLLINAGNQCVNREMAIATAIQFQIEETRRHRMTEIPVQMTLDEYFSAKGVMK